MQKMALNFDWTFKEGFNLEDTRKKIEGLRVNIPHTVQEVSNNYFDQSTTEGVYTYQKEWSYTPKDNTRLFVYFEGVMSKADIYLNGVLLSSHVGGYTAFKVELTQALKEKNILTVKVDSHETNDHPPFGNVIDYLTYGGIYREVTLIETPRDAVEYVLIDGDKKQLNVRMKLDKQSSQCEARFVIYDGDKKVKEISRTLQGDFIALSEAHALALWQLDAPKLYTLKVYLNDTLAHEGRFGIRTITVDENHFYLNGEVVFLRGLNRHQSFPYVGYAMPWRAQARDADILKYELSATMVRSSHYPPSRHFLDRCDEIGLLVFTELPGWQHIGDETWKSHAINDLTSLVIHDYNHPSVAIIGTRINESMDDNAFYTKTRDVVKKLDTTRPIGGVRFFGKSELLEDIYTLNDFVHRGTNEGLSKKKHMTKKTNPYLITEFNGHMFPTKAFDDETKRVEHAHRHFKVLNDAYEMKGVMGALGWCMNDYNTHSEFGSNDHICYHGVLDMNRNTKYAASVYASQGDLPYLNVLSMMHIGDRPGGELKEVIIATNCDEIDLYKNDVFIGKHTPSTRFSALPHRPIIIEDLIGNQIEENEQFTAKDAKRIKAIMLYMLKHGLKMKLSHKLQFARILLKYKMRYADAVNLYTKYVGGWGEKSTHYTFKGYKDGVFVQEVKKGTSDAYTLSVNADDLVLSHESTYDVTRVTVELNNTYDERAFYTHEVIEITVEGQALIIGPSKRVLVGGIESFWIKTTSKGDARITVNSEFYGSDTLKIKIN